MYFGSVRFFKHLIITVILLLIIVPVTVSIALAGQLKDKDFIISELNSKKDAVLSLLDIKNGDADLSEMSAEDFRSLLNVAGVEDKELVETVFKNNNKVKNDILRFYGYQSGETTTPSFQSEKEPTSAEAEVSDEPIEADETEESEETNYAAETSADTSAEATQTVFAEEDVVLTSEIPSYQELYPDLYADTVYSGEYDSDENYVYLTFDDGPSDNTPNILYYLDKHNVKATFFVIPDDTENCKKRLKALLENGHSLGIHTATHDYKKIYNSVEDYLEDFYIAFKMVEEQTGYRPFLFRFPGGSKNDYNTEIYSELVSEMTRRGFVYFDWNVDSRDALGANWTQMYNTVLSEVDKVKRAVILFHDGYGMRNTVLVIEDVVKALLEDKKCYTLAVITEKTRPLIF